MHIKTLSSLLAVALGSSVATLLVEHLVHPSAAAAQGTGPLQDYALYAAPRGDGTEESFIFVHTKTGDIWVYENGNVKEHYRVLAVGQKMEEVKR